MSPSEWDPEDDETLIRWVTSYGPGGWNIIIPRLRNKSETQCKQRYNIIQCIIQPPKIASTEEYSKILHAVKECTNNWKNMESIVSNTPYTLIFEKWRLLAKQLCKRFERFGPKALTTLELGCMRYYLKQIRIIGNENKLQLDSNGHLIVDRGFELNTQCLFTFESDSDYSHQRNNKHVSSTRHSKKHCRVKLMRVHDYRELRDYYARLDSQQSVVAHIQTKRKNVKCDSTLDFIPVSAIQSGVAVVSDVQCDVSSVSVSAQPDMSSVSAQPKATPDLQPNSISSSVVLDSTPSSVPPNTTPGTQSNSIPVSALQSIATPTGNTIPPSLLQTNSTQIPVPISDPASRKQSCFLDFPLVQLSSGIQPFASINTDMNRLKYIGTAIVPLYSGQSIEDSSRSLLQKPLTKHTLSSCSTTIISETPDIQFNPVLYGCDVPSVLSGTVVSSAECTHMLHSMNDNISQPTVSRPVNSKNDSPLSSTTYSSVSSTVSTGDDNTICYFTPVPCAPNFPAHISGEDSNSSYDSDYLSSII